MAKKDIELYYNQVCDQYSEMIENLREVEEYAQTNLITSEQIDNMKKMIEPIKNNYMTLSYIMFLLNLPNKKSKKDKYTNQNKKYLSNIDKKYFKDDILKNAEEILNDMHNYKG